MVENKSMIYLDYNATTPVDPQVLDKMLPWFYEHPGNAASRSHPYGWRAEEAVSTARKQVAALLEVEDKEIVFTSGATEAINLAIKGVYEAYQRKGKHIITVETEHKAVLDTCEHLERLGAAVSYLPVDKNGLIDPDQLAQSIRPDTVLVAVMWANNETGVLQDMAAIGRICAEKDVLLLSDATQAVGKIPVHPKALGIHLLACSAHKFYGPKGAGALYVSRREPRVKLTAQMDGGGHERGMRSGTLNVPGIVGMGAAAQLAGELMAGEYERLKGLRNRLEQGLLHDLEAAWVNGAGAPRLAHTANVTFRFVESEALINTFNQNIALSSGSACTSASLEPSHVLSAMGLSDDQAHSSLRFSLGRFTQPEEIETAISAVRAGVERLRAVSPVWEMFREGVDL